jgi:transposase InsO family protein
MTFVRNHAQAIVACDFFIVVTASFRVLYVFVLLEVGTRRIAHFNVTANPTATWTLQQFREVMMDAPSCRFVLHDRDRIYSSELDSALKAMDLKVLKTPFQAPQANAFAERWVRSVKEECLSRLILFGESSLRRALQQYIVHYKCVSYCPTSLCG